MSGSPTKFGANSLSLIRSLPTQLIPIDQIIVTEGRITDDLFLSRYSAFLKGKAPTHETRLSLSLIRRGFWKHSEGGWELIEDSISDSDLADATRNVRLGSRPVLHLYENPNPDDSKRFVCADDVVMHAAYEKLGISKVPVVLMAKPRDLEESSISIRCFPRKGKNHIPLLEGVVPVLHEFVPSILGPNKPAPTESFRQLLHKLTETKSALKCFHQPGATTLHYHHTLYSVLLRAEECVDSMRLLIEANKPLSAAVLLRSLHELALIFYVDWLAPGHTYQYLQMASVQSEKQWEATCEEWRKDDIAAGTSLLDAKNIKDAHMRSFRLGSIVGERARIFPLGEKFQRDVYSFLSDVIHHDFSMTARYAHTLEHGDEAIYHEGVLQTIVHLSDILVAAIVTRIRDDIGSSREA